MGKESAAPLFRNTCTRSVMPNPNTGGRGSRPGSFSWHEVPLAVVPTATKCHPGCVTPVPGSVVTYSLSADTVAVPSISIPPVVWSKLMKFNFVPGAALDQFGNVMGAGTAKLVIPGACTVMSNECCNCPGGSMSRTISDGTMLMPTWPAESG